MADKAVPDFKKTIKRSITVEIIQFTHEHLFLALKLQPGFKLRINTGAIGKDNQPVYLDLGKDDYEKRLEAYREGFPRYENLPEPEYERDETKRIG